jgi:GH25 family lysozyme M1 (1,4-beta-N-acetylmuramidase)
MTPDHWATCADVHAFAIFKCGNGNDGIDPTYLGNIVAARNAGLTVGTYHFVYILPDKVGHPGRSPEEQAAAHYNAAATMTGDMITWADIEWPPPNEWDKWELPRDDRSNWIADFILRYTDSYAELSGRPIGIYSYPDWVQNAGLATCDRADDLGQLSLWRAGPYVAREPNSMPGGLGPWARCDLYQWTGGKARMANGAPSDGNICSKFTLDWLSVLVDRI